MLTDSATVHHLLVQSVRVMFLAMALQVLEVVEGLSTWNAAEWPHFARVGCSVVAIQAGHRGKLLLTVLYTACEPFKGASHTWQLRPLPTVTCVPPGMCLVFGLEVLTLAATPLFVLFPKHL